MEAAGRGRAGPLRDGEQKDGGYAGLGPEGPSAWLISSASTGRWVENLYGAEKWLETGTSNTGIEDLPGCGTDQV